MSNVKILFLIDTLTDYNYTFFDKISKFYQIKVLIINKRKYENYDFNFPKRNYTYFIESQVNKKEKLNKIISNFKPNKIVFCGYRLKYINYIKDITKSSNLKYFYWLERIDSNNKLKCFLLGILFKFILKNIDGIFAIGQEAKYYYSKFNKKVFNIPYSIHIPKIKNKKLQSKKLKFLFVGQLIDRKGIDVIIKSLKEFTIEQSNYFEFTFIGNGKYQKKIQNLTNELKFVKYKKFLNPKKLLNYFKDSHVLIFPSRFDGWGVVPLQAMAHSMFVVLGNNCGVKEVIKPIGKNILININQKELSQTIKYILNNKISIINQGRSNYNIIKNSICNVDKSVKLINKVLDNIKK